MRVELIYDLDCPNAAATRTALIRAFAETGLNARWAEWDRGASESPEYARQYASPTILVEGADVSGSADGVHARACRVYRGDDDRLQAAPPVAAIVAALRAAAACQGRGRAWLPTAATLPAVGAILAPKLACPLCIPIVGSALAAAGVELFDPVPWVTGVAVALVALTLGFLAVRARRVGRWRAWLAAAAGGALMLVGKFWFDSLWLVGAGIIVFLIGAIASSRLGGGRAGCPACVATMPGEPGTN